MEHTGFQRQKNRLWSVHVDQHGLPTDESYHDINNLRYWIASKALIASDDSRWYSENRPSEGQAKVIASIIISSDEKMEINDLLKDIGCQLKQFKSICNHIDRR